MELPRNSGSSVWSGKCGWGISSDLFPLLSPLVAHVRAILLPRYTTKVVTRYRRHKAATPLGCTHSRYTDRGHPHGHTPSSKHIMDPRGQHASSRRTNSHNISRLVAGGALPGVRRPRSPTGWPSVPSERFPAGARPVPRPPSRA